MSEALRPPLIEAGWRPEPRFISEPEPLPKFEIPTFKPFVLDIPTFEPEPLPSFSLPAFRPSVLDIPVFEPDPPPIFTMPKIDRYPFLTSRVTIDSDDDNDPYGLFGSKKRKSIFDSDD
ncbi:hypothetical protein HGA34_03590 [Candidatus Falkowbacteria bacterium]|nr:hypothetical protein [Candidatus Falkowbacteria bacterium]